MPGMRNIYLLLLLISSLSHAQLQVSSALCENKINPLGVDISNIRFGWEMDSKEKDQFQTAYQVVIASTPSRLQSGNYDIWNSSVVKSKQSVLVPFSGRKLLPAQTYYWQVKVWDKNNIPSPWSNVRRFTTGLSAKQDWTGAKWIGFEELEDSMRVVPGIHFPLVARLGNKCMQRPVIPLFRKKFTINKPVEKALLFITGLGQYEVSMNGNRIGVAFLTPGWTLYDKTVLYNTYDVSTKLLDGDNSIGVIVGNGFYNINRERYFKLVTAFGMPKMICRLKITYKDGVVENFVSDESWTTSASPITFSSIYGGEDYDAQSEQSGWNTSQFNDGGWNKALQVNAPAGKLVAEQDYPVELTDSFIPKRVSQPLAGVQVYDFGQNISGIVQLKVTGKKGQVIRLTPAELINDNQLANQNATGNPFYFSYTLKGVGEEVWQPRFTYYGFRYVQVQSVGVGMTADSSAPPVVISLTAMHNRNSNPSNGSFECSNELFNRIYTLINWAIKSNMQSVITDCPHREKLSWLEQDYLMGASIHCNYDIYHLYRKLVYDLIDAQRTNGLIPDIAPEYAVFSDGFVDSPEWGSSSVILPWLLYAWYGDKDIVQRAYSMMKKYVAYLESRSHDHILSHGLGDWFDYGPKEPGEAQLTPKAVTATSIYYYDVILLQKMAAILNNATDAIAFQKLALAIKKSFNKRFFDAGRRVYATGSQTAMSMPLCVGLADATYKKDVLKNLVDSIYSGNKALTAGDIGFHFLVKALDDGGASQLIYDMNNRDDVPGYGFQLKKGATSLTESWPALENVSNNHLMLGHIMEWFYSGLAGISQEENSIGYKHIKIRPQPVGDITFAKGSFHSPYGWISCEWKKERKKFFLQVTIPTNTTAGIYLPATASSMISKDGEIINKNKVRIHDGVAVIETGSGKYNFEVDE